MDDFIQHDIVQTAMLDAGATFAGCISKPFFNVAPRDAKAFLFEMPYYCEVDVNARSYMEAIAAHLGYESRVVLNIHAFERFLVNVVGPTQARSIRDMREALEAERAALQGQV